MQIVRDTKLQLNQNEQNRYLKLITREIRVYGKHQMKQKHTGKKHTNKTSNHTKSILYKILTNKKCNIRKIYRFVFFFVCFTAVCEKT